ncbi:riboflavin synthase, partial [Thermococci archaeon]
ETLKKTNLGFAKVGEPVNLEFDIIGKYVENMIVGRGI